MALFQTPFYHQIIRKTIVAFGNLFSDLKIPRYDNDGNLIETVQVPIAYGPKEKTLRKVRADPNLHDDVLLALPRMAFEIQGYSYDAERKLNRNNQIVCHSENGASFVYSPNPYNVDISLYVLTKGTEDSLAVIEQICSIFSPEYMLSIKYVPEMNIVIDVPLVLRNVSTEDDYEGDIGTRRLVTNIFSFQAKLNLFGPVVDGGNNIIYETGVTLPGLGIKHESAVDPDTGELIKDIWIDLGID